MFKRQTVPLFKRQLTQWFSITNFTLNKNFRRLKAIWYIVKTSNSYLLSTETFDFFYFVVAVLVTFKPDSTLNVETESFAKQIEIILLFSLSHKITSITYLYPLPSITEVYMVKVVEYRRTSQISSRDTPW